jgi:EmrB/QacA subfamily drug resistance transporter
MHSPNRGEVGTATASGTAAALESPGTTRRWWALALLGTAQFMLIIDVTVVNVALPSIGQSLLLDRAGLTWVAIAYTLFFGSLLMLGGRLADTFGRRRIFLAGLGIFTLASVTSGIAPNGTILIVARAFQGIGAALLSPAALSIVTTLFQGPERNRALGIWAALGGSGAAFGVIIGGILATGPGWQWIFFVNVPVGILVALGASRLIPPFPATWRAGDIDLPAVALITPAIGLVLYALIGAGDAGWASLETLAPIGLAVVLLTAFAWREQRAPAPLVRLSMFAERTLSGGLLVLVSASALLAGTFFVTSIYAQRMIGLTPLETGLAFVPVALALIVGAQVASRLVGHAGGRLVAAGALVLVGLGLVLLARVPAQGDALADILPGFVLAGFGLGATLVTAMTSAFARVDNEDSGIASGLVNTGHEVGFALGIAILSSIAGASLAGSQGVAGFQAAFMAGAAIALLAAGASIVFLPADRPRLAHKAFAH